MHIILLCRTFVRLCVLQSLWFFMHSTPVLGLTACLDCIPKPAPPLLFLQLCFSAISHFPCREGLLVVGLSGIGNASTIYPFPCRIYSPPLFLYCNVLRFVEPPLLSYSVWWPTAHYSLLSFNNIDNPLLVGYLYFNKAYILFI